MKQYNGVDIRDKIIHLVYTTHVFVNPVSENVSDYELKFDFPLVKKNNNLIFPAVFWRHNIAEYTMVNPLCGCQKWINQFKNDDN